MKKTTFYFQKNNPRDKHFSQVQRNSKILLV